MTIRCLPLAFFANRRYSAAIASLALLLFALLGLFFLFTQYLQFSLGFSPLQTGLAIAPVALVLLVAAPVSVILARRFGTKSVVAGGLFLVAIGLGLLSRTTVHSTYVDAVPSLALIGVGVGFGLAPSIESVMGSLPTADAGVGSATSDTSMQLGGALGVAVLGTALNIRYQNFMTPLLAHQQIPPSIDKLILGSLGGALAVAGHVPGKAGEALAGSRSTWFRLGHGSGASRRHGGRGGRRPGCSGRTSQPGRATACPRECPRGRRAWRGRRMSRLSTALLHGERPRRWRLTSSPCGVRASTST